MNGPGGATNATPGPDHMRSARETARMADKASIPIPGSKSSIETCRICEMRPRYDHGYGFDFGICSVCAEAVANSYCYTHSGKWLTRPNAAAVPPRPPMPADLRWSVLRDDNFTCQKCGATDRPLHVDHLSLIHISEPTD